MKPLLVLIAMGFTISAFAQSDTAIVLQKDYLGKMNIKQFKKDSLKVILPPYTLGNQIPNAFNLTLPTPRKIGNNGKGQDIYTLPLDNMPMIKPDSTYYSTMPNGILRFKH